MSTFKKAEWSDGDDENQHISSVILYFNTSVLFDSNRIVKVTLTSKNHFFARFKNTSSGIESTFTRSRAEIVFFNEEGEEFTIDVLDMETIELVDDLNIIQKFKN